jgi:hypothetical protein
MLLVMDSAKVFSSADGYSQLWTVTWDRIGAFLPTLRDDLFKSHPSVEEHHRRPDSLEATTPPLSTSPPQGSPPTQG